MSLPPVKMIFLVFLLCIFSLACGEDGLSADEAAEGLITSILERVSDGEFDTIRLKDFSLHYKYYLLPSSINCKNGYVKSVLSLRKADAVNVTKENNTETITIPLEFRSLEYHYNNCRYTIFHLFHSFWNSITVKAQSNSLQIEVTITREDGKCDANVSDIKFVDIGDLDVRMSGNVGRKLQQRLAEELRDIMINQASAKIIEKLQIVAPLSIKNDTMCKTQEQLY